MFEAKASSADNGVLESRRFETQFVVRWNSVCALSPAYMVGSDNPDGILEVTGVRSWSHVNFAYSSMDLTNLVVNVQDTLNVNQLTFWQQNGSTKGS